MDPEQDMETVHREAERWFARLRSDDCSTAERVEFDAWISSDTTHALAYAQVEHLWNDLGVLCDDVELKSARRAARRTVQSTMRRIARRRRLVAAALFTGALAVAASFWFVGGHPVTRQYTTAHGEQRSIVLADGSRVMLNTDTILDVTLETRSRSVRLIKGEALFDVIHNAARPFLVHASGNVISDLGTRFDVDESSERTTVTVLEGSVNVEHGNDVARLNPGQQLVAGSGIWRRGTADPAMITAWSQGLLRFSDTPLAQAIADTNRYTREQLVISDARLNVIRVSGEFRIGNTQSFLRALQSAFPIRIEQNGQIIRLYHR